MAATTIAAHIDPNPAGSATVKELGREEISQSAKGLGQTTQNKAEFLKSDRNKKTPPDLGTARRLQCRIRCFTDGAVICGKKFLTEAFAKTRVKFGGKRKTGARVMRGSGGTARGML